MDEFHDLVIKAIDPGATLAERHRAFERLVLRFQDMAFAYAYSILGDFQLAEDAAQEAFISAWRNLHQLRKAEAFPGWFKQILHNSCCHLRRGKGPQTTWLDPEITVPSDKDGPQARLERRELRTAVFSAIERLPKNERMVIALFYLNEKSQRDISSFLEVPMTTVAKRLYSARTRIRGKLTYAPIGFELLPPQFTLSEPPSVRSCISRGFTRYQTGTVPLCSTSGSTSTIDRTSMATSAEKPPKVLTKT